MYCVAAGFFPHTFQYFGFFREQDITLMKEVETPRVGNNSDPKKTISKDYQISKAFQLLCSWSSKRATELNWLQLPAQYRNHGTWDSYSFIEHFNMYHAVTFNFH